MQEFGNHSNEMKAVGGVSWPNFNIPCDATNSCNKISNGGLDGASYSINSAYRPIGNGHIMCWNASHGNPFTSASDRNNIPTTINWAQYNHDLVMTAKGGKLSPLGFGEEGDGVFQSGLSIKANRLYFVSFLCSVSNCAFEPFFTNLNQDVFHVPANCDNLFIKFANGIQNQSNASQTPLPLGLQTQTVGQLTNIVATDSPQWVQMTVCVKANNDYSTLWFYPFQNPGSATTRVRIKNIQMQEAWAGDLSVNLPCNGGSAVQLGGGCATIPGATYSWSPAFGLSNPNVLQPTLNGSGIASGQMYTLTVSRNGCSVSDTVTITNNKPVLNLPPQVLTCKDNLPIYLNANPSNPSAVITYQWYMLNQQGTQFEAIPGANAATLLVGAFGWYVVVADGGNGCTAYAFTHVAVMALPANLNTDFGLWTVAPAGQPTFQLYTNPANQNWNGMFHAYYLSEVDANFQNPQFIGIAWGNNGLQLLQYSVGNQVINTFNRETYYEIKHGIWNECGDWTETRRYLYVD